MIDNPCADVVYLDHAGATPYAKSLIESYARDLTTNLYGNPHSVSASSQRTTDRVDDIRLRALKFFNADPDVYDLVFVSNATAGIKLVADAMRDGYSSESDTRGFWYGYHADSHTSLVGVREVAELGVRCFESDDEVATWIAEEDDNQKGVLRLFSYPAQSNMNGRRLPLCWCKDIRRSKPHTWTLLDAAAYAATAPLDLGNPSISPDFVVVSFHKIFGFPDLGGLIVRKDAGHILRHRRYFGGGTVDMVVARGLQWHAKKQISIHGQLEDGTLPFHNIIALDHAMTAHERIFGSMANVAAHTRKLASYLYRALSGFEHSKNSPVCRFYVSPGTTYDDLATQGPIIAFNLRDRNGNWIGGSEIERLASIKGIHLRSGTLCNPGGVSGHLGLTDAEMQQNYEAGQRCGDENDILNGKPTGALRVSLGAMSSWKDVQSFVAFIEQFFVTSTSLTRPNGSITPSKDKFYIESLHVYPIKSCAAYKVPPDMPWQITREGLAWDREWCIVHQGTGVALSQKRYPRMALIRPSFDFAHGVLRISTPDSKSELEVSLARDDDELQVTAMMECRNQNSRPKLSRVCGDTVTMQVSTSDDISTFFSDFLGVPCTLARLPPQMSSRYSKAGHALRPPTMPGTFPTPPEERNTILLSNESPILLISRSSVNQLNKEIQSASPSHITSRKVADIPPDVFRANIIVTENLPNNPAGESSIDSERPYLEDKWTSLRVGAYGIPFDVLGSCQRCQMVCVDQITGECRDEPYSTLARTRRMNGRVWFGRHLALRSSAWEDFEESSLVIRAGDVVIPHYD